MFRHWPDPDPITLDDHRERAADWRRKAQEARDEALRRPWWSPARRGYEAEAAACQAEAERLDPTPFIPAGAALRGVLARLEGGE